MGLTSQISSRCLRLNTLAQMEGTRRYNRRPMSSFLPYIPYRPQLKRTLTPLLEKIQKVTEEDTKPTDIATLSPSTPSTTRYSPCSLSTNSSGTRNSPNTQSPNSQPVLHSGKLLPLPPPLMVKTCATTTKGQRFNVAAPIGSKANPAELPGTPPWEWLPELHGGGYS